MAFRGTTYKYSDIVKADFGEIALINAYGDYYAEAKKVTEEVINLAKERGYSLSLTGHSLGGWLAQMGLYHIESSKIKEKLNRLKFSSSIHLTFSFSIISNSISICITII